MIRLALSLAILAALLCFLPLDMLGESIASVSPSLWIACFSAFVVGHLVGAFKWGLLIQGASRLPFGLVARYYFFGLFANLFLPSVAGGDFVRAGLALRQSADKATVVLGSVLDRLLDICSLLFLLVVGALWSREQLGASDGRLIGLFFAAFVVGTAGAVYVVFRPPSWLPARVQELLAQMREAIRILASHPGRAVGALCLSFAVQSTFVLLNLVLGGACGVELAFSTWCFAWPFAKLVAMAPVSLAGIGVREAALAGILSRFGVPGARAVGVGLVWETIVVAGSALGGGIYLLGRRFAREKETETR